MVRAGDDRRIDWVRQRARGVLPGGAAQSCGDAQPGDALPGADRRRRARLRPRMGGIGVGNRHCGVVQPPVADLPAARSGQRGVGAQPGRAARGVGVPGDCCRHEGRGRMENRIECRSLRLRYCPELVAQKGGTTEA